MSMPTIAIINFSSRTDTEVLTAIRAVNRQIQEDFLPIWGQGRHLRLFNAGFQPTQDPGTVTHEKVPAESVIYLVDESTVPGALGYHDVNTAEMPFGFVFALEDDWTATLSHEALELILDPNVNAFVLGPHPRFPDDPHRVALHTYEACDAVERFSYEIDGVLVSDFVTPQYFGPGDPLGTRNDFLGVGLRSFSAGSGCHISYIDPATGKLETIFGEAEAEAPTTRTTRRRHEAEHAKRRRPGDEELRKVLEGTRSALGGTRRRPLASVRGITRTARYVAAASALRVDKKA